MRNKIMALTIMILMASLLFATMPASAETLDPSDLPYGTYIIHKVDECVWLKNIDGDTCEVNQETKIYAWQGLETLTLNTDAVINSIWVGGQDHDNGLTINGSGRLSVKNNEPGGSGFFAYGSITIDGCHVIADNNGGQGIESQGGDQNAGGIIVKNGGSLSTKTMHAQALSRLL